MNEFGMSGDDLEQMYQEVILEASKHPHGKESFAPNAAVEQSADAAANVTVQASHEYCTPVNRTSSTRPAATRRPSMSKSPMTNRTPSSDWCGTATAAPFRRPACR